MSVKKKTKVTSGIKDEVRKALIKGESVCAIAEHFGISTWTIYEERRNLEQSMAKLEQDSFVEIKVAPDEFPLSTSVSKKPETEHSRIHLKSCKKVFLEFEDWCVTLEGRIDQRHQTLLMNLFGDVSC
jgi:transposase-like protein